MGRADTTKREESEHAMMVVSNVEVCLVQVVQCFQL